MIDWLAFVIVFAVALVGAGALVSIYAAGLRLLAIDGRPLGARVGAYACFVVAALGALFGIYLIIPALHGG